jgi:hypothetical protein
MQALIEGSCLLFPHLECYGLSDVRFSGNIPLPPGITRECALNVKKQALFPHDGLMTQMCRTSLQARNITDNGRHTGGYTEIISGTVHMTAAPYTAHPLWPTQICADQGDGTDLLKVFYKAEGLGDPWRLLVDYEALPEGVYVATYQGDDPSALPGSTSAFAVNESIAQKRKSRYDKILRIVEGIIQTIMSAIAGNSARKTNSPDEILTTLRHWRLSTAGFIIFNTLSPGPGVKNIQIRKTWDDGKTVRFDAQATDTDGRTIITLHHLEFFRRPPVPDGLAKI